MGEDRAISDVDRDSLHILPLAMIPLESPMLRSARMVKNTHLESVIELFDDDKAGRGQVPVEGMIKDMQKTGTVSMHDMSILRALADLPSYDVYSLRVSLREEEIPVNDVSDLQLSDSKSQELASYMHAFTRPLIMEIYGADDASIQEFEDVLQLFRDPDVKKAREKLQIMADKLDIEIQAVPRFLEDYGDIFLSLSYYRQCLDRIEPIMGEFIRSLKEIRENYQLKSNPHLMRTCDLMEQTVIGLDRNVHKLFKMFDVNTRHMWDEISAESFHAVQVMIQSYHTSIGAVLCALTVEMDSWQRLFPKKGIGGPVKRSEFIMTHMRHGVDAIRKLREEAAARRKGPKAPEVIDKRTGKKPAAEEPQESDTPEDSE